MSDVDRTKWNQRYRESDRSAGEGPSAWLVHQLPRLRGVPDKPRALDVACGLGRNSLYLAAEGWQVDAVDISPVALEHLARRANEAGLPVRCLEQDLEPDSGRPGEQLPEGHYDLVIIFRYTNMPLLPVLARSLRPGGYLLVEGHMKTDLPVIGPGTPRFRVPPGALRSAAAGMSIVDYEEGMFEDPEGRPAALARMLARR